MWGGPPPAPSSLQARRARGAGSAAGGGRLGQRGVVGEVSGGVEHHQQRVRGPGHVHLPAPRPSAPGTSAGAAGSGGLDLSYILRTSPRGAGVFGIPSYIYHSYASPVSKERGGGFEAAHLARVAGEGAPRGARDACEVLHARGRACTLRRAALCRGPGWKLRAPRVDPARSRRAAAARARGGAGGGAGTRRARRARRVTWGTPWAAKARSMSSWGTAGGCAGRARAAFGRSSGKLGGGA